MIKKSCSFRKSGDDGHTAVEILKK